MLVVICVIFIVIIKHSSKSHKLTRHVDPLTSSPSSTRNCKHVTVDELDRWFNSTASWDQIPKIIHQTWKNQTLRQQQAVWSETWCTQYTDWFYHLWTDVENEEFVRTKFPWFYSTYKQLNPAILRADSVRYLYMFHYGGIYVRSSSSSSTNVMRR